MNLKAAMRRHFAKAIVQLKRVVHITLTYAILFRRYAWRYLRLLRLDRPIGIWLLLWPTLWALWIAGDGKPQGTRYIRVL